MSKSAAKGYRGIGMNGPIASWYAGIREKDMAECRNSALRVSRFLGHFARVLEIAPGPGFMAIELARLGDLRGDGPRHQRVVRAHGVREGKKGGRARGLSSG